MINQFDQLQNLLSSKTLPFAYFSFSQLIAPLNFPVSTQIPGFRFHLPPFFCFYFSIFITQSHYPLPFLDKVIQHLHAFSVNNPYITFSLSNNRDFNLKKYTDLSVRTKLVSHVTQTFWFCSFSFFFHNYGIKKKNTHNIQKQKHTSLIEIVRSIILDTIVN